MKEWITEASEVLINNQWISVKKSKVLLPNGHRINDYYTVDTNDAAAVVAIDAEGHVILKEEYRYACRKSMIEIPAGMIENEEDPLTAAKRELLEETGYASDDWQEFGISIEDPTRLTGRLYLFLAQNCVKVSNGDPDAAEEINVLRIPLKTAVDMVMNNKINCSSSAHAILMTARKLNI